MKPLSKTTWLVIILIFFLLATGFISYLYRQVKGELVKQTAEKEILLKQLNELKKQTAFVPCRKLNVKKDDPPVPVYLLNSFTPVAFSAGKKQKDEVHMWNFIFTNPSGFGSGMGATYTSEAIGGISEEMPIDINEDGEMDRVAYFWFGGRKIGDYLIVVFPQGNIPPAKPYSLQIGDKFTGDTITLAKDVFYTPNLFEHVYILRQTEDGIIPIVPASVGCNF